MFANSQMGGSNMGFPDTCTTAAGVPAPFPNTAQQSTGVPAAYKLMWMCTPAHNLSTTMPTSNGDEAGTALGLCSGTIMGPGRQLTASFTVLAGGMPATKLTSVTLQNSTNAPGATIVPSQVKVLLLAP